MATTRNLKKSPKLLALEQINLFNGVLFPENKITLGTPKVIDIRADIKDDSNTYIPASVDINYDGRYGADCGFLYRRYSLDDYLNNRSLITNAIMPVSTHSLLADINDQFDINLTEDDILNTPYLNNGQPLKIQVNPDSLFWIGEDINVTLQTGGSYRNTEAGFVRETEDGGFRTIDFI